VSEAIRRSSPLYVGSGVADLGIENGSASTGSVGRRETAWLSDGRGWDRTSLQMSGFYTH